MLIAGDNIYSDGTSAAAASLASLHLTVAGEALLGAAATTDASQVSAILQQRFSSASCTQALAGIDTVQSEVQVNAAALSLNLGLVADALQTAHDFVTLVGETYRWVFVGALYGLAMSLLGVLALGLAARRKTVLNVGVYASLVSSLGALTLSGTMLALLVRPLSAAVTRHSLTPSLDDQR